MTAAEDLKPCPFCAARLEGTKLTGGRALGTVFHHPLDDESDCPLLGFKLFGQDAARIDAWNSRVCGETHP